ncbi:MAG: hypothetical protein EHM14_09130 [Methanothrix sp.]|nr:MAG: hypothetical protein EHM14_09130 [Methanothrix sp.]
MPEINDKPSQCVSVIGNCLSDEERAKLIANLHRVLVWVGVKVPEECRIDQKTLDEEMERHHQTERDLPPEIHMHKTENEAEVDLNHIIWRLINESEITEEERLQIEELIDLLQKEEKLDEDKLREQKMTREQAKKLFNETAGVIRALLDLKDLLKKKERSDEVHEQIRHKVFDAKRWNDFMEKVKNE